MQLLWLAYRAAAARARDKIAGAGSRSVSAHNLVNCSERDGCCIFQAAKLAWLLKYPRISVIEFGCGGGNGLLNAEMHITEVMKIFPVDIELYGFDMGSGLPQPRDYRDMPYYFQSGLYKMD